MLYEVTFPNGSETMYENLEPVKWAELTYLIEKYKKPFKVTPIEGCYPTKYCFPVGKKWLVVSFTRLSSVSIPNLCWILDPPRRQISRKKLLQMFQATFDELPENLASSYAI